MPKFMEKNIATSTLSMALSIIELNHIPVFLIWGPSDIKLRMHFALDAELRISIST